MTLFFKRIRSIALFSLFNTYVIDWLIDYSWGDDDDNDDNDLSQLELNPPYHLTC